MDKIYVMKRHLKVILLVISVTILQSTNLYANEEVSQIRNFI